MRIDLLRLPLAAVLILFFASSARAQTPGTPGTEIVYLVTNCEDAGHDPLADPTPCVETLADLQDLIWDPITGRHPAAADPLVVNIGPGDFVGSLTCPLNGGEGGATSGWTTFRGLGRERSRIVGSSTDSFVVNVNACAELAFQDLSIDGTASSNGYGVYWQGGGTSSWTNVDIEASLIGWQDWGCGGLGTDASEGTHYFWNARITSGNIAYVAECGETWLYGSQIHVEASNVPFFHRYEAIHIRHRGDVRAFGSTISVAAKTFLETGDTVYGVRVGADLPLGSITPDGFGTLHMHGGIINALSTLSGFDVVGLDVSDDGDLGNARAHTLGTAFTLSSPAQETRVAGDGTIQSPLLWQSGTAPPVTDLGSITGQDVYVETDCKASGCPDVNPGDDPHLMIYKSDCANSPWWDLARGQCRD